MYKLIIFISNIFNYFCQYFKKNTSENELNYDIEQGIIDNPLSNDFNTKLEQINNILRYHFKKGKDYVITNVIKESYQEYFNNILSTFENNPDYSQFSIPDELTDILINEVLKWNDKINPTIYDPCIGVAKITSILSQKLNINSKNIYGYDISPQILPIADMNLYLSTNYNQNLNSGNSLVHNYYLNKIKFDIICCNPPFGCNIKYDTLLNNFDYNDIKFEDVYPIKTNDIHLLFLQHCVYMLDKKGVCGIILPSSFIYKENCKVRNWIYKSVNILLLHNLNINFGINYCILVFNKKNIML